MKLVLAILVIASVVALPFHVGKTGTCGDCCGDTRAQTQDIAAMDGCCPGDQDQSRKNGSTDPDHDRSDPCDGCDCPLRCCITVAKAPVIHEQGFDIQVAWTTPGQILPNARGDSIDPHLDLLKRPPRA